MHQAFVKLETGYGVAQYQQYKTQRQEAVDPKQGRMRMHWRCIQALYIEQGNGGVNHEPKDPGTKQVPEGTCNETHQGPFDRIHPGRSEEHTPELQSRGQLVCRL